MATATRKHPKTPKESGILQEYDAAVDAKNRITLRGAKTKYFHVTPYADGSYLLEPRVLVTLEAGAAKLRSGKDQLKV